MGNIISHQCSRLFHLVRFLDAVIDDSTVIISPATGLIKYSLNQNVRSGLDYVPQQILLQQILKKWYVEKQEGYLERSSTERSSIPMSPMSMSGFSGQNVMLGAEWI